MVLPYITKAGKGGIEMLTPFPTTTEKRKRNEVKMKSLHKP